MLHKNGVAPKPVAPAAVSPAAAAPRPVSIASAVPERVGVVSHYFPHSNAGIVSIESGELRVGDTVHFRGHTTDFYQRVERLELEHRPVEVGRAGQQVGVQVSQRVREHDEVIKVSR